MSTAQQPYVVFNFYPCGVATKLRRK